MAHAFDSGLASPQRTLVRDAVRDALAELLKPSLPSPGTKYLAALVEIPAPVRFDTDDEALLVDTLQGRSPAVAIALGGRDFAARDTDATSWHGTMQVHVYVCTTHARSLMARHVADVAAGASDTVDPGLDTMSEHVFERLAGLELAASRSGALRPLREEIAFVGGDWTVIEQVYAVDIQTDVNPDRALTQDVTDIHSTHEETVAGEPSELVANSPLEEP